MNIVVNKTPALLGAEAARHAADVLNEAIGKQGKARIVLSTGASQLDLLKELVRADVDWSKVDMFHLDEYVGLPESHPASFRKYLKERFLANVNIGRAFFVDGEGDIREKVMELSEQLRQEP